MAIAVIGGLVVSTALSLLVVPAFFVTTDGMAEKLKGWARALRPRGPVRAISRFRRPAPPRASG